MIGLLIGALAAPAAAATRIPETAPIYCLDSKHIEQPVRRTNYAQLTAAYRKQFGLGTRRLDQATTTTGSLTFRGGKDGAEYISYGVEPYSGTLGPGILLTDMHVRLGGATDDLVGDRMCWRTFSIVYAQ